MLGPALGLAATLACTSAGAATLRAAYDISLAGLPLATAEVSSALQGTTYRTEVQARTTGIVGLVASGKGGAIATGSLAGGQPVPASFSLTARTSKNTTRVRLALAQGNVVEAEVVPPVQDRPDRVPVREAHKRGVIDPVSALLLPVHGRGELTAGENCNRTIPVFDGAARYNIVASYAGMRQFDVPGYRGPVLVCNLRYVPLAGHRAEREAVKFMMENREISVWLAPLAGTRLLAPVRVSLRTMVGTAVAEATRFAVEGAPAAASARPR